MYLLRLSIDFIQNIDHPDNIEWLYLEMHPSHWKEIRNWKPFEVAVDHDSVLYWQFLSHWSEWSLIKSLFLWSYKWAINKIGDELSSCFVYIRFFANIALVVRKDLRKYWLDICWHIEHWTYYRDIVLLKEYTS